MSKSPRPISVWAGLYQRSSELASGAAAKVVVAVKSINASEAFVARETGACEL